MQTQHGTDQATANPGTERIAAFSDGVIAIIITIMVLGSGQGLSVNSLMSPTPIGRAGKPMLRARLTCPIVNLIHDEERMTYDVHKPQSQWHLLLVAFTGEDEAVWLALRGSSVYPFWNWCPLQSFGKSRVGSTDRDRSSRPRSRSSSRRKQCAIQP